MRAGARGGVLRRSAAGADRSAGGELVGAGVPTAPGHTLFHSKAQAANLLTCVAVQHGGNLKRALRAKL